MAGAPAADLTVGAVRRSGLARDGTRDDEPHYEGRKAEVVGAAHVVGISKGI